jgi:alpha-glucosidase
MRWLEFGIFTPLMRNHAAKGTRQQEAYQFQETEGFRHVIGVRYKLLPYIYSEYMKAVLKNDMLFRPLCFDYPEDSHAPYVEDQLMYGDSLMLAPIYEANARGRYVYLPESMKKLVFCQDGSIKEEILPAGHHYISVALTEVCFFLRKDCCIPLSSGGSNAAEVDFDQLHMLSYSEAAKPYEYYHDDGQQKDYDNPSHISWLLP